MAGLGTIFICIMGLAVLLLALKRLESTRLMLWVLMLSFSIPVYREHRGLDDR